MTTPAAGRPRTPLDQAAAEAALRAAGSPWTELLLVPATGSTNADLVELAGSGAAEGALLVADEQSAGRGRLDRRWTAPSRSALLLSVLLRPPATVPAAAWGWVPLLVGLGVHDGVRASTGVPARLKWPNDVVVDGPAWDSSAGPRKLAGILVERVPGAPALVAGVGLNADLDEVELPVPAATSLLLEAGAAGPGSPPGREVVLAAVVAALARRWEAFVAAAGDAERSGLAPAYRAACLTLGQQVQVALPVGTSLLGTAVGLDTDGALELLVDGRREVVRAGDVVHVRPA